eukprot:6200939-Pleurochrysis_carterae.AAC.5
MLWGMGASLLSTHELLARENPNNQILNLQAQAQRQLARNGAKRAFVSYILPAWLKRQTQIPIKNNASEKHK